MEKFGYVFATKKLVDEKRKVKYMYREKPSNEKDSGWRFFCGEEDDDYVNNPNNIEIYDITTILNIDKSIFPYLNSAYGVSFEREDDNKVFVVSQLFESQKGCE